MFFAKLAFQNIRKNQRIYLPFMISMIFIIAINMMTLTIVNNPGMHSLPDAHIALVMFRFGLMVVLIFSVIFAIYTNNFLLKQRKKEFGLYNILGLGKRELYLLALWENLFSLLIVLVAGTLSGLVFAKLGFLTLKRILKVGNDFVFQLSGDSFIVILMLTIALFLLLYGITCGNIARTNPLELLQSTTKGEKKPKGNLFITILGLLSLGAGYTIALLLKNPDQLLQLFFLAIVLVILGTFALFTSGSVTLLNLLQKNKKYYYHPNHFISVSNMSYRMRQHALGLASICILSTMALVTVTTTASLYFGRTDRHYAGAPLDVNMSFQTLNQPDDQVNTKLADLAEEEGVEITEIREWVMTHFYEFSLKDGTYVVDPDSYNYEDVEGSSFAFMPLEDYNQNFETEELADNEILVSEMYMADFNESEIQLDVWDEPLKVKKKVTAQTDTISGAYYNSVLIVVKNREMFDEILANIVEKLKSTSEFDPVYIRSLSYVFQVNFSGDDQIERVAFANKIMEDVWRRTQDEENHFYAVGFYGRDQSKAADDAFMGGFFFLGILFSIIFSLATVLIIYYKQVSEGMDDKKRFDILQKIGMSHQSVKKVIRSQVLMVFSFPLVMALSHLLFAYPVINQLLQTFNQTDRGQKLNENLFLTITLFAAVIFALLYGVVYQLTARAYYQLVERKSL